MHAERSRFMQCPQVNISCMNLLYNSFLMFVCLSVPFMPTSSEPNYLTPFTNPPTWICEGNIFLKKLMHMYIGHTKLDSWSETRCAEWLLLLPLMGVVRLPEIWTRKTRDGHLQSGWLTATQWYDLYVWTVLRNEWYADLGGAWMCRCDLESTRRRRRRRSFTVLIGNSCRARFHGGGGGMSIDKLL